MESALLAHLVGGGNMQRYHAFQRLLLHRNDAAAGQVLAQQHAEHRRLGGIIAQLSGQVQTRLVGTGIEQQAAVAAQQQNHLIPGRLLNFFNSRALNLWGDLPYNGV